MAKRCAGPGRPRANRAELELRGVVPEPTKPGRISEAVLPQPRSLAAIVGAFAKVGAFNITLEFGAAGLHFYGAAERAPHSASTPALLVTVPAAAMVSYYCARPGCLEVARVELAQLCDGIAAGHQLAELYHCDDLKELHLTLRMAGLSTERHCALSVGEPRQLPGEPGAHCCWWTASYRDALAPLLANLPTGVHEQITFACARAPGADPFAVTALTHGSNPAASLTSTTFAPKAGGLAQDAHLRAIYYCAPLIAVKLLAAPTHSVKFYLDRDLPLVVTGDPRSQGGDLLERCYFRLEAPHAQ